MNRLIFVFLFFCLFNGKGQKAIISSDIEISYNMKYKIDSLKNIFDDEIMKLYIDTSSKKSIFENAKYLIRDSLINQGSKGQNINFDFVPNFKITTSVYKEFTNSKGILVDDFVSLHLKYEFNMLQKWKLLSQKKKILSYDCNLAFCYFGGRKFFAWYTTSIPFNDGPYKFNGLPGLILSVYDEKNNFNISAFSIKKVKKKIERNFSNFVNVKKDKYFDTKINYILSKNPRAKIVLNPIELKPE